MVLPVESDVPAALSRSDVSAASPGRAGGDGPCRPVVPTQGPRLGRGGRRSGQ